MSVAQALDLAYSKPTLAGVALAWDDAIIMAPESPTARLSATATLKEEMIRVGGDVEPVVLWFMGDPEDPDLETIADYQKRTGKLIDDVPLPSGKHTLQQRHEAEKRARAEKLARASAVSPASISQTWMPNDVVITGRFEGDKFKVTHELWWTGSHKPGVNDDWGFESNLIVRNDGVDGVRQLAGVSDCSGGNEHNDFPGRYNGDRTLSVPFTSADEIPIGTFETNTSTSKWAAMQLYVDWWQYADPCAQKNYDFGIGKPTVMETNGYGYGIAYTLTMNKGTAPAGPLYAYGQAVHDDCPSYATTLCMDLDKNATFPPGTKTAAIYGTARHAFMPGQLIHNDSTMSYINGSARGTKHGDSTGDGAADLLYVWGDSGTITAYRGSSSGSLSSLGNRQRPIPGGHRVKSFAKVPDLDGDSYADYFYIDENTGALILMIGGPQGTIFDNALTNAQLQIGPHQIGQGWAGMKLLVGKNSLYAIRTDGKLSYYPFSGTNSTTDGGLRVTFGTPTVLGQGWGTVRTAARVDWNRDGVWDILAVGADGTMRLYTCNATGGIASTTQVGHGWSDFQVSVGGDLTGDGHPDLIARTSSGTVYVYPLTGSGFGSRRIVGTGFSGSSAEFLT
ncbi:FG-GAP repeat domain-containing protein [Aestuariimicrobium ganziense]|uniref:FG-GAP repeat domain-containing protein n=1 Tax=Aestuariimicrobium ganziense TaxID=2773677 RepID=UPI0019448F3E|nr:VCBS repeat-containing protein [Aestuariimicrobium ganziense]